MQFFRNCKYTNVENIIHKVFWKKTILGSNRNVSANEETMLNQTSEILAAPPPPPQHPVDVPDRAPPPFPHNTP